MLVYTRMSAKTKSKKGLSLKTFGWIITGISLLISTSLIVSLYAISNRYERVRASIEEHSKWEEITKDVQSASDYLTEQVRSYVITKKDTYLVNYFHEALHEQRREKAIEQIQKYLENTSVYENVTVAINESMELMNEEYYAMRLIVEAKHSSLSDYPEEIQNVVLSSEDIALSDEEKSALAIDIVYGNEYNDAKDIITSNINLAVHTLHEMQEASVNDSSESLRKILIFQECLIIVNVLFLAGVIVLMYLYLINPVYRAAGDISRREKMSIKGIKEYRLIAQIYNNILEQNNSIRETLEFEATHDKTTGLLNRTGYDTVYKSIQLSKAAFILCDIDEFKGFNDQYGHEMGDKVLIKVSEKIKNAFNDENAHAFRIGGDEFVIIYENVEESFIYELIKRFNKMNDELKHRGNSIIPPIALSAGIAKGDEMDTTDTLFRKADIALYFVKKHGRGKIEIYNVDMKRE